MEQSPIKLQKPPSFLGAIIYIFAGIIITAAGIGMTIINVTGEVPYYYPGAVWQTIGIVYMVLGGIVLGLSYKRMKRFLSQFKDTGETGEAAEAEHFTETLAEKRP